MFGLSELAVILIVVIAVLAAKKLPDLARSAGKSARILKAEARAMKDQQTDPEDRTTPRVIQGETATPQSAAPTDTARPSAPTGSERPPQGD
ncbi:twin-arginine translocase TatA/TatE family subunit [Streptomyces sp. NPDC002680]|uniref:twin-arginine translocase TatA/TatE family subunit n=1 Tax=Streptomyces sp. NPDC002680 TaxID=3364659 RepID=UPI00367846DA